jgi:hypothetical protein
MTDINEQWRNEYLDGWAKQGVLPTSEPTIPSIPRIPADISDFGSWAYEAGKSRGNLDRLNSQAGLP